MPIISGGSGGGGGGGSGDMAKATYDPANKNEQVLTITSDLDLANAVEATNANLMTDAELAKLNGIEASADVTDAANVGSSINGASAKAVPVVADKLGLLDSAASFALKVATIDQIASMLPVGSRYRSGISISPYVYSNGILDNDPTATKFRFDSLTLGSITKLWIDPLNANSIDQTFDIKLMQSGDQIIVMNPTMTTVYTTFTLSSAYTDKTGYYEFSGAASAGTLPTNGATVTLVYVAKGIDKPMRLAMDLLIASRDGSGNVNGILDKDGNQIAGQRQVANYAALPAVAGHPRETYRLLDSNLDYTNDGTNAYWYPQNKIAMVLKSANLITVTVPAATFVAPVATTLNSGTDIRLTSAGAHGLTSAVNVGQKIHVSAGTNWTPGLYTIKTIAVDTSGLVIDLEEPFVSGMGIPTITLAGTGQIPIWTYTTHAFTPSTSLEWDITTECISSANIKRIIVNFGGVELGNINQNVGGNIINRVVGAINNQNNTDIQRSNYASTNTSGSGTTTTASIRATIDTDTPKTWGLYYVIATAGEWMECSQLKLKMLVA